MRHALRVVLGSVLLLGMVGCAGQQESRTFVPSGKGVPRFELSPLSSGDALGLACASPSASFVDANTR